MPFQRQNTLTIYALYWDVIIHKSMFSFPQVWWVDENDEHRETPQDHPYHPKSDGCVTRFQCECTVLAELNWLPTPVPYITCYFQSFGLFKIQVTSEELKTTPPVFQVNANELTNGVINAAFMLLFKDAIRLFAAYNEGIINLLGKNKLLCCHGLARLLFGLLVFSVHYGDGKWSVYIYIESFSILDGPLKL